MLQRKLTEAPGVSIVDQVGLSSGWEGHPHCGETLPGKNQKDAFMRHKTKRVRDHKISHRNWGRGITAVFEDLLTNTTSACLTSPRPVLLNPGMILLPLGTLGHLETVSVVTTRVVTPQA